MNELEEDDAKGHVDAGCKVVAEEANMPLTAEAKVAVRERGLIDAPGKAANAGGVALSGLAMSQSAMRKPRSREVHGEELREIMTRIHDLCADAGGCVDGVVAYAGGANIAGFGQVAEAMVARGSEGRVAGRGCRRRARRERR